MAGSRAIVALLKDGLRLVVTHGNGPQVGAALLDLYTIIRERRTLDGLTIAMIGELDVGRTARPLFSTGNERIVRAHGSHHDVIGLAAGAGCAPCWSERRSHEYAGWNQRFH